MPDDELPEYEEEADADHSVPTDLLDLHQLIELRDAEADQ